MAKPTRMPRSGQGNLDDDVGHRPPSGAVRRADWSQPKNPGRCDERLGIFDLLVEQAPGELPVEPADAPGAAHGEGDDGQPEEGDGQDHAGERVTATKAMPEAARGRRHEETRIPTRSVWRTVRAR